MKLFRLFTLFSFAAFFAAATPHLNAMENNGQAYQGQQLEFVLPQTEENNWDLVVNYSEDACLIKGWEPIDGSAKCIVLETRLQDPENPMTLDRFLSNCFNEDQDTVIEKSENEVLFLSIIPIEEKGCEAFSCVRLVATPQAYHYLSYLAFGTEHEEEKWISAISNAELKY